jgi:hypothetical protein
LSKIKISFQKNLAAFPPCPLTCPHSRKQEWLYKLPQ